MEEHCRESTVGRRGRRWHCASFWGFGSPHLRNGQTPGETSVPGSDPS
jgi:hypothetical protein